ncbi:MAG: YbjN domain-containing protein [Deltaproteobacteria bacterium]|jgi:hypothetical protein|nr:YbjN domain-containing protein [Deltaproteobacteria bacterium]
MRWLNPYICVPAVLLIILCYSLSAYAQSDTVIHDSLTLPEIIAIMEKANYKVVHYKEKGVIAWELGNNVIALVSTDKPKSINFYTYERGGKVTLEDANNWNRDFKYSKTYLDEDKDVVLELDLDLTGGVTERRIIDFFASCKLSHEQWLKQVINANENK